MASIQSSALELRDPAVYISVLPQLSTDGNKMYFWITQGLVLVLIAVTVLHIQALDGPRDEDDERSSSSGLLIVFLLLCGFVLFMLGVNNENRVDARVDAQVAEFKEQLVALRRVVGHVDQAIDEVREQSKAEQQLVKQLEAEVEEHKALAKELRSTINQLRETSGDLTTLTPALRTATTSVTELAKAPPQRRRTSGSSVILVSPDAPPLVTIQEKEIMDQLDALKKRRDELVLQQKQTSKSFRGSLTPDLSAEAAMRINRSYRDFLEHTEDRMAEVERDIGALRLQLANLRHKQE